MNALGIGLRREGVSLAMIDVAGVPLALAFGDSGDALQRQLLALRQGDPPILGVAALNSVLKRPGVSLCQIESGDQDGAAPRLLEEALAECSAVARTAAGEARRWVAAIDDGACSAAQLWDAASRVPLAFSAAISRNAAMANYLAWWTPPSLGRCRVLDLDVQGTLRRGELTRRGDGGADYTEEPGAPLETVRVLLDSLGRFLEAQLGSAASDAPAICARVCEQLLLECLASNSPNAFGSCVRSVRGKEITFTLAEAEIGQLLQSLADLVRVDSLSGGSDLPTVLLCPLLGDEMRVRLLDLTLAHTLLMPRNALAALAYGAALDPAAHSIGADKGTQLASVLGVFAGDRRDPHRQRFLPLIDAGTSLPAAASRTFFSRGGGTARMVFELAMGGAPEEPSLARIIVPIPAGEGPCEVQLSLRLTGAGECSYSVSDSAGGVLASGFAGRVATTDATHCTEPAP